MTLEPWFILAIVFLAVLVIVLVVFMRPRIAAAVIKAIYPSAFTHIHTDKKVIAIAIDDGPDPATTIAIGQLLANLNVPGTFFLIGSKVLLAPEIITSLKKIGHQIGAHFFEDSKTAILDLHQVQQSHELTMAALTPHTLVTYVRPGFGIPSKNIEAVVASHELTLVVGDIPALDTFNFPDWFYLTYLRLVVQPGSIVTFHDCGDRGDRTKRTLPTFINWARSRGYTFVLLDGSH